MRKILISVILLSFAASACASFSNADKLYSQARQMAREGRADFAFMNLNELLRDAPNYRFAAKAKFAVAEYYFLSSNYYQAISEYVDFLKLYPQDKFAILAKAFLYKIINDKKWLENQVAQEVAEKIRQEFFSQSAFFIFSEYKETKLTSLLSNKYLIKEYVDKIDIFQNGKLFFNVSR